MSASIQDGFIGRSNQKDVMYGVVDMLLLGECDDIILSPESTFGGVAAARVGAQPWRITKNPLNATDASWDSVRIVARAEILLQDRARAHTDGNLFPGQAVSASRLPPQSRILAFTSQTTPPQPLSQAVAVARATQSGK